MDERVRAGWQAWNEPFEGAVRTMYADIKNLVSVGVGNLIDPIGAALGLPFVHHDGTPVSAAEIAAEWHRVKDGNFAHDGWTAAAKGAALHLTDGGISALVMGKLEQMAGTLVQRFPEFESWPWQAQQATLSMSWAAGPAFYAPLFSAAVRARDWTTAAKQCHFDDSHNPGLRPRNAANRALFLEAAAHEHDGDGPAAYETEPANTEGALS